MRRAFNPDQFERHVDANWLLSKAGVSDSKGPNNESSSRSTRLVRAWSCSRSSVGLSSAEAA